MTLVDIIVLVALGAFFVKGFRMGLVRGIATLIGLVVGLWLAGHYYAEAAGFLEGWGLPQAFSGAAGYIAVFLVSMWVISIVVWMADRVFKFLAIVPGMKLLNSLLGGALFLLEGVLIIGVILYVISQFNPPDSRTARAIEGSRLAPMIRAAYWVASPLIPASIEAARSALPSEDVLPSLEELNERGDLLKNLPSPWSTRQ